MENPYYYIIQHLPNIFDRNPTLHGMANNEAINVGFYTAIQVFMGPRGMWFRYSLCHWN
jgi:hypothetical protein